MTRRLTCRGKNCNYTAMVRTHYCARCTIAIAKKEEKEAEEGFHKARWMINRYAESMGLVAYAKEDILNRIKVDGKHISNVSLDELEEK